MNVHLMYDDRDFDPAQPLQRSAGALTEDLGLEAVFHTMAADDELVLASSRQAVLSAVQNDTRTIRYRQAVLRDCLAHPGVIRRLYDLAGEALEAEKRNRFFGFLERHPGSILSGSVNVLDVLVKRLRELAAISAAHSGEFTSNGFTTLFSTIERELTDEYFGTVDGHLRALRFPHGVLLSAELANDGRGARYALRDRGDPPSWWERLREWVRELVRGPTRPVFRFRIADRDEAGARALSELKDRGLNGVANALAQSADQVRAFFSTLRTELAFYIGCSNLHERLAARGQPVCFPVPTGAGSRGGTGIYDIALALNTDRAIVGNAVRADGKGLVVITGANQGGKSSFLRAVGLAQLMMQAGMFVGAESFEAEPCTGVFTHFKRGEDATMKSGKLDEELARFSEIVDELAPESLVLFNESFAATNEREGSEIATQIVHGLREKGVRIWFVTHLYEFARGAFEANERGDAMFLRAERLPDGTRTFRLSVAEPQETSHGADVYAAVFSSAPATDVRGSDAGCWRDEIQPIAH